MAIHYSFEAEGDTLIATASGFDENRDEVRNYGIAIIEAAVKHGSRRVLCLETELDYRLGVVDTFEVAACIAERAPRVARIAIVHAVAHATIAKFWETVAVNRGLIVHVFADRKEAETWLGVSSALPAPEPDPAPSRSPEA